MYLLMVTIVVFRKWQVNIIWKGVTTGWIILFLLILSSKNQVIVFFVIISVLIWKQLQWSTTLKLAVLGGLLVALIFIGMRNDQIKYRFQNEITRTTGDRGILWSEGLKIIS